jgi:solute:Na+ symporter, SSS family
LGCIIAHLPGTISDGLSLAISHGKLQVIDTASTAQPFSLWAGLLGGAFLTMASHGTDQVIVQRCLCGRSLFHAQVAMIVSGVVIVLQFSLFLLIGVGLFALHAQGVFPVEVGTKDDAVIGLAIARLLPIGLMGFILTALLASAMSTLSASLNSLSAVSLSDFYKPLLGKRSEIHYLTAARVLTVLWAIVQMSIAVGVAMFIGSESLIAVVLGLASLTSGVVLGLFFLDRLTVRNSAAADWAGLSLGILIASILGIAAISGQPLVAWPWNSFIVSVTIVIVAIAGNVVFGTSTTAWRQDK